MDFTICTVVSNKVEFNQLVIDKFATCWEGVGTIALFETLGRTFVGDRSNTIRFLTIWLECITSGFDFTCIIGLNFIL